jgi:hypothetical protein
MPGATLCQGSTPVFGYTLDCETLMSHVRRRLESRVKLRVFGVVSREHHFVANLVTRLLLTKSSKVKIIPVFWGAHVAYSLQTSRLFCFSSNDNKAPLLEHYSVPIAQPCALLSQYSGLLRKLLFLDSAKMDHVPTHPDSYHSPLPVTYMADTNPAFKYDGKGFLGFPDRLGIDPQKVIEGSCAQLGPDEVLTFFQSWCFFGLVTEILKHVGILVTIEEFIQRSSSSNLPPSQTTVSMKKLPWIMQTLCNEAETLSDDLKASRYIAMYECLRIAAKFVHLGGSYKIDASGRHFFSDATTEWETSASVGNTIHLSTMILGDYIGSALVAFYKPKGAIYDVDFGRSDFFGESHGTSWLVSQWGGQAPRPKSWGDVYVLSQHDESPFSRMESRRLRRGLSLLA